MKIKNIKAREILDSRGFPTIETTVTLESGVKASAAVPSGASTGKFEAIELRDGGKRLGGKGVLKAIDNVNNVIAPKLYGQIATDQELIDKIMIELDGTENKARLGANAILSVSLAICKVAAKANNLELYQYINKDNKQYSLPRPMMNILNGGVHADNKLDIQEFMIVPSNIATFNLYVEICCSVYHALKNILKTKGFSSNIGDEGGFAPQINNTIQALDFICEAIEKAGYKLGDDVQIALDVAASELLSDDKYSIDGKLRKSSEMIEFYQDLLNKYPLISIEDPLAEEDWNSFTEITEKLGSKVQIVGDDLFVTNYTRLKKGITCKAANAILIKLNQIGTVTETLETIKLAQENNYNVVISHRSGETTDTYIADLSVAVNAKFIKTGAPARGERVAKYNRLLAIQDTILGL